MKSKLLIAFFATFMMCSCANKAEKELLTVLENATEQMENANDCEEGKSINNDLCDKMKSIGKEYEDDIEKIDDKSKIDEAFRKYMDVRQEKCGDAHLFMVIPSVK